MLSTQISSRTPLQARLATGRKSVVGLWVVPANVHFSKNILEHLLWVHIEGSFETALADLGSP